MYRYIKMIISADDLGKKLVIPAIKIVILIFLAAYLFSHANGQAVITYLNKNMVVRLLSMQPFIIMTIICVALRFAVLLGHTRPISFMPIFKAIILTLGLNIVLPARTSELVKPLYLAKNMNIPFSNGIAAVFLEKMIDIIIILTVALVGLGTYVQINSYLLLSAAIIVAAIPVMITCLEQRILRMVEYVKWTGFIRQVVMHVAHSVRQKFFYKAFLLGLTQWSCSFLSVALFLKLTLNENYSLDAALLIFVFIIAGGSLPIVPGGFGTYEAAVVFAFQLLGYKAEEALPIAVLLHVSQLVFVSIGTVIIICMEKINLGHMLGRSKDVWALARGKVDQ